VRSSIRFFCISLLLAPMAGFAAPPANLDSYVERAMSTFGVPGFSLGVVEQQATTVARGYGVRRLGEAARVDERTLFAIGSNTKAFTAAALAVLVDRGQLKWDDRVVDRLPGFRMFDAYASREMTVRDLLVHRSGLGLGAGDLLFFPPSDRSRAEIVESLRNIPPATSFRSGYAYDNVLYIVAGQLIEELSMQPWEKFVEGSLLAPLGMKDSVAVFTSARTANLAWPHARLEGEVRGMGTIKPLGSPTKLDNAAPAGSIGSSATDMLRWLSVQLAHGALSPVDKSDRLFSEASAREMWKPHVLIPDQPLPQQVALTAAMFNTYALGWNVRDYRGAKIVTHSGGVEGTLSLTVMIPEKNVGIVAMINSEDGGALRAVFYRLIDHYLGLESPDWIEAFAQVQRERVSRAAEVVRKIPTGKRSEGSPSLAPAAYAGVYRDTWYGTVTITAQDKGALQIRFDRSPGMVSTLEHVRHDTFRTRFAERRIEDTYVTFALRPDGSIDQMKMQAVSPIADFSFDYHDLLFKPVETKP
jgi:CubicO group peptidase (beta-lactamase class C family)